jgi:hypothetical protein
MSVEANSAQEGEKAVSELLSAFIQSHPELTSDFGAKAIQGQVINEDGMSASEKPMLDS